MIPVANGFRFNWNSDGKYTVSTLKKLLESKAPKPHSDVQINWSKVIPLKIRCFIWRVLMNRIPVAANLEVRGIKVETDMCPLCNKEKETCDHLLIRYEVAIEARSWIFKWCGILLTTFNKVTDFIRFVIS
uniref:Reverse transcriptase zinc-binding domain-containing protein n=1 Tax=Lactuca sativa TaxID=4236 RepID=A0A9R1V6Z2_LACSA|nr:hypothetical protein LSAT_V11C600299780 [Lactuca sativa]